MPSIQRLAIAEPSRKEDHTAKLRIDAQGHPIDALLAASHAFPEGPLSNKLQHLASVLRNPHSGTARDRSLESATRDIAIIILERRHIPTGNGQMPNLAEAFRVAAEATEAVASTEAKRRDTMASTTQAVIYPILQQGIQSSREIAGMLHKTEGAVTSGLKRLAEKGLVKPTTSRSKTTYKPMAQTEGSRIFSTSRSPKNVEADAIRIDALIYLSHAFARMADEGPDSQKARKEARNALNKVNSVG